MVDVVGAWRRLDRATTFLIVALAAAVTFRLYLLVATDFPVNDGGLFVAFVRATAATFPGLPREVEFNGLVLPFAYPPFSFWIGALSTRLGLDSIEAVRTLPILFNMVYVLLFALLLLKSGRSRLFAALAILFMAVTLRSYEWLLMGGGLSRGLGAIFLLLTLIVIRLPESARAKDVTLARAAIAGIMVAGAILSHFEWGILAAASVVLSRALGSRSIKDFVLGCAVAGATATALVAPWVLFVHASHGLEPFLSARSTSHWSASFAFILKLIEFAQMAGMGSPFVFVGGAVLLARRDWFWIGFVLICVVLTPRHALTPLALAMGVFAAQGFLSSYDFVARFVQSGKLLQAASMVVLAALLIHGVFRSQRDAEVSFRILPQETRQAMAWVAAHERGQRFAFVTGRAWQDDRSGEWFPLLASAVAVTTVQGHEWIGDYARWHEQSYALRDSRSCDELEVNLKRFGTFEFIWAESMHECFNGFGYRTVFRNRHVTIYQSSPARVVGS